MKRPPEVIRNSQWDERVVAPRLLLLWPDGGPHMSCALGAHAEMIENSSFHHFPGISVEEPITKMVAHGGKLCIVLLLSLRAEVVVLL